MERDNLGKVMERNTVLRYKTKDKPKSHDPRSMEINWQLTHARKLYGMQLKQFWTENWHKKIRWKPDLECDTRETFRFEDENDYEYEI